ncbi:hypothetical protein DPMN_039490 [Dreissena polymorpha]|uniref:Uncharacterized protein n=1 Tax=Dreissena polymorpha TaxID=45954 RepID=A0A9D4CTC0_DREPO|nr:hypothetical protein DPMN_039490 [Dreissena polymorpha]
MAEGGIDRATSQTESSSLSGKTGAESAKRYNNLYAVTHGLYNHLEGKSYTVACACFTYGLHPSRYGTESTPIHTLLAAPLLDTQPVQPSRMGKSETENAHRHRTESAPSSPSNLHIRVCQGTKALLETGTKALLDKGTKALLDIQRVQPSPLLYTGLKALLYTSGTPTAPSRYGKDSCANFTYGSKCNLHLPGQPSRIGKPETESAFSSPNNLHIRVSQELHALLYTVIQGLQSLLDTCGTESAPSSRCNLQLVQPLRTVRVIHELKSLLDTSTPSSLCNLHVRISQPVQPSRTDKSRTKIFTSRNLHLRISNGLKVLLDTSETESAPSSLFNRHTFVQPSLLLAACATFTFGYIRDLKHSSTHLQIRTQQRVQPSQTALLDNTAPAAFSVNTAAIASVAYGNPSDSDAKYLVVANTEACEAVRYG